MGLHETPMSFTQEEKSGQNHLCETGPPAWFFKKIQTEREKAQERQSSHRHWDGGFSSPHDSIFSKPSLLDTKDVKETQEKKAACF